MFLKIKLVRHVMKYMGGTDFFFNHIRNRWKCSDICVRTWEPVFLFFLWATDNLEERTLIKFSLFSICTCINIEVDWLGVNLVYQRTQGLAVVEKAESVDLWLHPTNFRFNLDSLKTIKTIQALTGDYHRRRYDLVARFKQILYY